MLGLVGKSQFCQSKLGDKHLYWGRSELRHDIIQKEEPSVPRIEERSVCYINYCKRRSSSFQIYTIHVNLKVKADAWSCRGNQMDAFDQNISCGMMLCCQLSDFLSNRITRNCKFPPRSTDNVVMFVFNYRKCWIIPQCRNMTKNTQHHHARW